MKIKEEKKNSFIYYLKIPLKVICRWVFNKKTKIIFLIISIIFILSIGTLLGLILSGYFGTFDAPSQRALDIAHYFGIVNLREIKNSIEGIKQENVMIPINFIRGQFSNPKKIFIDISFTNYQKIAYKREQAIDMDLLLNVSGADYVPAKIRYEGKEVDVRLRLKGDMEDHWKGDKWSFRIKVRGNETLFGMKTFSIQDPKTRVYLNEFIYHQALKREDVLALRYDFIEVVINGENKGIYALEEHFEKELIEYNNRREGVIIKFNEDLVFEESVLIRDYFSNLPDLFNYLHSISLDPFYKSNIDSFDNDGILEDPVLSAQFEKARNLLESYRKGSLEAHEVFDIDKFAKYFAINTLTGAGHASTWTNIRFYYNPITSFLEPIGFDAGFMGEDYTGVYFPDCLSNDNNCSQKTIEYWHDPLFRNKIFFKKYIQELEKVSQKSYLDNLFLELDGEIKKNLNILYKDYPTAFLLKEPLYRNQQRIRDKLNPIQATNTYFQKSLPSENKIILSIGNIQTLPLEIINVVYNNSIIFELNQKNEILQPRALFEIVDYQKFEFKIPASFVWDDKFASNLKINYKIFGLEKIMNEKVLPWSYVEEDFLEKDFIRQNPITEKNISSIDFLDINNKTKKIIIKKGYWTLDESVIIPEGYTFFIEKGTTLNLIDSAMILSYSNLQFSGTKEDPIKIISSDKTGQGLTVLNAEKLSTLNNVIFDGLTNPSKEGWELTGAITFHKSPVKLDNVFIKNINSEDSLNIIDADFEIKDSSFENCGFDCFDGDFVNGSLESSLFNGCGNDCIDFSGSNVNMGKLKIINSKDKGISIGERSKAIIENIEINSNELNKTYICIASKDQSKVFIKNSQISNCEYGFAVYQKKSEFGPSSMESVNTNMSQINNDYIIEKGSSLLVDNIIMLKKEDEVYRKLYES